MHRSIQLFVFKLLKHRICRIIWISLTKFSLFLLIRKIRKNLSVKSIYLRRSGAFGETLPGLSDIDIGVIIRSANDSSAPRLKHSVYTDYINFIRHFPKGYFDTNLAIYTEKEITQILEADLRGINNIHIFYRLIEGIKTWRLLYGQDSLPANLPKFPTALIKITVLHELFNTLSDTNIIYRSNREDDSGLSKDMLSKIKYLISIYKRTSDLVRLSSFFLNPELPLTFTRRNSISFGLKILSEFLIEEDIHFLKQVELIPANFTKDYNANLFVFDFRRFLLRFNLLVNRVCQENLKFPEPIGLDASRIICNLYPACSPAQRYEDAPKDTSATPDALEEREERKKTIGWFRDFYGLRQGRIMFGGSPYADWITVYIGVDTKCPNDELRKIIENIEEFKKFRNNHVSPGFVVAIILYPFITGMVQNPDDIFNFRSTLYSMITRYYCEHPKQKMGTSFPFLFCGMSDDLKTSYEKFWISIERLAIIFCILSTSYHPGLLSLGRGRTHHEHLVAIFSFCQLPVKLLGKLKTFLSQYQRYLADETDSQPTWVDFVSFLAYLEDYVNKQMSTKITKQNTDMKRSQQNIDIFKE